MWPAAAMTVRSPQREQKRCSRCQFSRRDGVHQQPRVAGGEQQAGLAQSGGARRLVHAARQGVLLEREVAHAVLVGAEEVAVGLGEGARRRTASSPVRCGRRLLSSISAWPPETTKTRVVGWLHAAASQASSSRWCAARSMPPVAVRVMGRSGGCTVGPGGHFGFLLLLRQRCRCAGCRGPAHAGKPIRHSAGHPHRAAVFRAPYGPGARLGGPVRPRVRRGTRR